MTEKMIPLSCPFDVAVIQDKVCQNQNEKWHIMPKQWSGIHMGKVYSNVSFIIQFDKKHSLTTAIFCYRCFLCWLGECANDLRKLGSTEDEIAQFVYGFRTLEGNQNG